jgi:hypothetical protein
LISVDLISTFSNDKLLNNDKFMEKEKSMFSFPCVVSFLWESTMGNGWIYVKGKENKFIEKEKSMFSFPCVVFFL